MKVDTVANERVKEEPLQNIRKSLLAGVWGYLLFLIILFLTKELSSLVIRDISLQIETTDFILPLIGFFLMSLIKFLESLSTDEM